MVTLLRFEADAEVGRAPGRWRLGIVSAMRKGANRSYLESTGRMDDTNEMSVMTHCTVQ